jgi:P pilus assembly chaperone PapD
MEGFGPPLFVAAGTSAMKYFTFILLILFTQTSYANFKISPLSQSMDVKKKSASYTLENMTSNNAAYKVTVVERDLNKNGEELRIPTKELRIFPSKIILKPLEKKRVKVLYLGKRDISIEKSYRVIFTQLDRDVSEEQDQGLQSKFNFNTAFYVTPKEAKADLNPSVLEHKGNTYLSLNNQGNGHIILQDWKLQLTGQGNVYPDELPNINILAGKEVLLPLNKTVAVNQDVEIIYN